MMTSKRFSVAAGSLPAMVLGMLLATQGAFALDLSGPALRGNLAVYLVHDTPRGAAPMTTIDDALRRGKALVSENKNGLQVDNFSGLPILVPFGTLLRGGSQDQVVAASQIVPPHSEGTYIDTYCVDPFRASQRDGESATLFSSPQLLTPSQSQKLSLLVGNGHEGHVTRLRQAGVWWAIDTLREQLAQQTGAPLAPLSRPQWSPSTDGVAGKVLQARTGGWLDSLPLALDDSRLATMTASIASNLGKVVDPGRDVVGAAFAIDGRWVGTNMFRSQALFKQIWPMMLKSYIIQSIAERGSDAVPPPSASEMEKLMRDAQAGDALEQHNGDMHIRDGSLAVVTELDDARGHVIEKTYVPKLDPDSSSASPDRAFVQMLAIGEVEGRSIAALDTAPILTPNATRDAWTVSHDIPHDVQAPVKDTTTADMPVKTTAGTTVSTTATEAETATETADTEWDAWPVTALLSVLALCWIGLMAPPLRASRVGRAVSRSSSALGMLFVRPVLAVGRYAFRVLARMHRATAWIRVGSPLTVARGVVRLLGIMRPSQGFAR